ncbi:hypothetical protein B0H13DRAFT_2313510 [Mycena leptocephala]|nr:hypothetical protein B0H13DRAFT_2313510 [Mycena leptocephala]
MSSVQLPPTLHLCIRPSTPSISHPSILSPAGSPAYYFLDTAVRTCAAEPQTPELATYDMARPPPFPCCDGYGLTLGIVGFWCVISIITLLLHPSSNTTEPHSVNFSAYRAHTLTAIRTTADRTGPPALRLLPARDIGRSSILHIRTHPHSHKTNKSLSPPSPSDPCTQCAGYRRTAPPPVCTFCLRTTLRSSFPRVPSRIGHLHINPASSTQFWMRAPLSSTPILPVLPTLFRPRLEFFLSVPPYTPSSRTTNNTNYPAANCSACLRAPCFSLGSRLPRTLTPRLRTMFSVLGMRFSIPCRRRFYTAARTDVAPWEMTLALARSPL